MVIIEEVDVPESNYPSAVRLERDEYEKLDGEPFKNEIFQGQTLWELAATGRAH